MTKKEFIPLEEEEQYNFVEWLEIKRLKFTAIPNSTWTPSYNQKRKNHAMGLRAGFPDMIVIIPESRCALNKSLLVVIEMKRKKRSKVSDVQQEWIDELEDIGDVHTFICYGADEAIKSITSLLKK